MYNYYNFNGVIARERDGRITVKSRSGNYVALTTDIAHAVRKFVEAVQS